MQAEKLLDHERQRGCLGFGSLGWVDEITA
jgi:hypothetical protein